MLMSEWAAKHNISKEALQELYTINGTNIPQVLAEEKKNESQVTADVRLRASMEGWQLWRNNVGAALCSRTGRAVRYGLCNESRKMNQVIKSSDLIGIKPVLITGDLVGQTIGQFIAREVKHSGWRMTGKPREMAQLKFLQLVNGLGGDAKFVNK